MEAKFDNSDQAHTKLSESALLDQTDRENDEWVVVVRRVLPARAETFLLDVAGLSTCTKDEVTVVVLQKLRSI
jgi:hypothetical protein